MEAKQHKEIVLIEKAQAGDKDAFGQLFDHYFNKIFNYLRVRTENFNHAEDLTEVVFFKAWEHLTSFKIKKGENQFKAWLFRIAYNTLVDHYRTQKDELDLVEGQIADLEKDTLEKGIVKTEEQLKMSDAIKTLDVLSQQVIICRFVSDLSHRETARVLGISEGYVRVIQYRALKKMRKLLRDDDV